MLQNALKKEKERKKDRNYVRNQRKKTSNH